MDRLVASSNRPLGGNRRRFLTLIFIVVTTLLFTTVLGAIVLQAEPGAGGNVHPLVWQDLWRDPGGQATYILILGDNENGGPESAIDVQIVLADLLESLISTGIIDWYLPFYGESYFVVSGSSESVRFLADTPGVAAIEPYLGEQNLSRIIRPFDVQQTGQISGTVSGPNGSTPLVGIEVRAYRQEGPLSWLVAGTTTTAVSGTYGIGGLETGIYRVRFRDPDNNYVTEYYNNRSTFSTANAFIVIDEQTTADIDASMEHAGHVTGKVTDPDGEGLKDVGVNALYYDGSNWQIFSSALTDKKGEYDIGGLISETYRIQYHDVFIRFVTEYYDNWGTVEEANDMIVQAGVTVTNINATLGPYGSITGTVTGAQSQLGLEGINVTVYKDNNYSNIEGFTDTDDSGNYEVNGLLTNDYQVEFLDPSSYYTSQFFDGQLDINSATNVSVTLGLATGDINAVLLPPTATVTNTLVPGWNLISYPIQLEDPAVSAALSSIAGTYEIIWAFDACAPLADQWTRYDPDVDPVYNTLDEIKVESGLWLQMMSPETLEITGWENEQVQMDLCAGWNLVGYPSLMDKPVEEALVSIIGKYNVVYQYVAADAGDEWKKFDPDLPFGNTLSIMQSGYGYWIEMNEAATWTISNRQTSVGDPN